MSDVALAQPPSAPQRLRAVTRFVLRANRPQMHLFAIAGVVLMARFVLLEDAGVIMARTIWQSISAYLIGGAVAVPFILAVEMHRKGSIVKAVAHYAPGLMTRQTLATTVPAILALACILNSFSHFKAMIPLFNPYDIDPALAALDRALHFGQDPWRLLAGVMDFGLVTKLVDTVYYGWFAVFFATTGVFLAMPATSQLRNQYLVAYALTWSVLGIGAAVAFASVGPIFYDRLIGGTSEFTALMAHLGAVDAAYGLNTMIVADNLWQNYLGGELAMVSGISAMPSLHNAVCVLLVLAARRVDRTLGLLATIFALTIFVGSVHLGWHYAIDAYASLIGVVLIWKLAGVLTRRQAPVPALPATA